MAAEPAPWAPPAYELSDATSLQALARGDASEDQQRRALKWIIENAAGTYDLEYRKDARDHAFVSGRRFVGLQIVKMLKLNTSVLK